MADIKISDTFAQTRALNEFRHLDQQERALSERMAAQATERELVEHKKDVEESDRSVAPREDGGGGGGGYRGSEKKKEEEEKKDAPPESSEGHLLDLKA